MTAFSSLQASMLALLTSLCACTGAATPADAGAQAPAPAQAQTTAAAIARAARPITGGDEDYADILAATANVRRFMLGESTHGTSEFYRERARLTERLIQSHGVNAIAIEGDWTPTARVNNYVQGRGADRSAREAVAGYTEFPQWMWTNTDFVAFVERLRAYNLARPEAERVGLYGMDVYDMFDAADAVVVYLRRRDPAAAMRAERQYRCFRRYGRSTTAYGEATLGGRASCKRAAESVVAMLRALPRPAGAAEAEAHFAAVRAASSVQAGEDYYRTAYGGTLSWNVRDRWMARNVEEIAAHVEAQTGRPGKVAIWSHNSHTGDARATDMPNRGEINLGQLMRERHGEAAFLIGFFAHEGNVLAATQWGERGRVQAMRPAVAGSHAALFRAAGVPAFSLLLRGNVELSRLLTPPMQQRAIGVVYLPANEAVSHYGRASLARQFDAVIYADRSTAVSSLARAAELITD